MGSCLTWPTAEAVVRAATAVPAARPGLVFGSSLWAMYRWRRTIVIVLLVALVALVMADVIVGFAS